MRRVNTLRALGAAVLAVSLAGCMKVDMQLDLNTDDTVDGSMVFALSKDVMGMAQSMGEDMDSMFDEMNTADLPEDTKVEDYEDDDFVGKQYTFEGASLSDFAQEDGFGIVHEGDEFVVTGAMDMGDVGDMGDLGDLGADMGELGDLEGMMDSFDVKLSITFPGEVIEHNGELDGTTVTWTPKAGENQEISARAKDSGGGAGGSSAWLWIVIAAAVVIALLGLLFFLSRNKKAGTQNVAADGEGVGVAAGAGAAAATGAATDEGSVSAPPPPPAAPTSAGEPDPEPGPTPENPDGETR